MPQPQHHYIPLAYPLADLRWDSVLISNIGNAACKNGQAVPLRSSIVGTWSVTSLPTVALLPLSADRLHSKHGRIYTGTITLDSSLISQGTHNFVTSLLYLSQSYVSVGTHVVQNNTNIWCDAGVDACWRLLWWVSMRSSQ